jgi:sirohydrochlorin cobaltochelatase
MLKKSILILGVLGFMTGVVSTNVPKKKAILLVTFGTSVKRAMKAFDNIERKTKERFKSVEVRWAYTSQFIRKKLKKQGRVTLSPEEALKKLAVDGYTHVAAQSLHVIPGLEYDEVVKVVNSTRDFKYLKLGPPLLASSEDVKRVTGIMMQSIPEDRQKDDAVVFMGHGTHHRAGKVYDEVNMLLKGTNSNASLAVVEGHPEFDKVREFYRENNIKKTYMIPFMSVAGDHAMNDMAGDEEDSWKSKFQKDNVESVSVMKGMAENDEIVDVWLDHLDKVYKEL